MAEFLRKEQEKAVAEGDGLVAGDLFGQSLREQFGEGQGANVGEVLTELSDMAGVRRRGSMSHEIASVRWWIEERCIVVGDYVAFFALCVGLAVFIGRRRL